MAVENTPDPVEPDSSVHDEPEKSRGVLMAKAAGLLVVMAIVGVALLIVIWLLVTIVVSLVGSL